MDKSKLLKAALKYHNKGFKVIFTNEKKKPVAAWKHYREQQSAEEITKMYEQEKSRVHGVAIICTDGVEIVDVDQKYSIDGQLNADYFSALTAQLGEEEFFSKVTIATTTSGGAHLIYRTDIPEGNQKLASRHGLANEESPVYVLLETRGIGGYFCVAPTPGYSFDTFNGEVAPKVSNEWRNIFINTARTFDEVKPKYTAKSKKATPPAIVGPHLTTIDAFNGSHTAFELLEAAGWQFAYSLGEEDYLVRPGKSKRDGISAGYHNSKRLVFIFTTSSQFDGNKAYNAFQVYSVLNHNGDYSAAAKELYRAGYGDRIEKTQDTHKQKQTAITQAGAVDRQNVVGNKLMEQIYATRFDINRKPEFIDYCLTYRDPYATGSQKKIYNIAAFGDLVTICGLQKSRKSALTSSIVGSALAIVPTEVLRFTMDNKARNIVYIDTEQSDSEHHKQHQRTFSQAKVSKDKDGKYINPPNYYAFRVRDHTKINRLAFASWISEKVPNTGLMVIDGLVDMCNNYNDLEESQTLVDFFMRMASAKKMMVIFVLHNARSTKDLRGHLGTELLNKSKAIIEVIKDGEGGFSTVNFKDLREAEPKEFDFTHDANGNLVEIN